MKIWQKTNLWEFQELLLEWRHRDGGRFASKIFSWLLGAFVFAILTSIFFASIHQPDAALPTARFIFFLVFVLGVGSNFMRSFVHGYAYQITRQAIVQVHPYLGWERLGELLGSKEKPFRQVYYYIDWKDVKEIREETKGILIVLKDGDEIQIPVLPVIKVSVNLNVNPPEQKNKGSQQSEKAAYDIEVLRMTIRSAREARKSANG